MLRSLSCLLLLLALGAPALAEDEPKAPPRPKTEAEAVARARTAFDAKDQDALRALATLDYPDPWVVAEMLWVDGRHDVAKALAKAAPRVDTQGLAAHVATLEGQTPPTKAIAAFRAAEDAYRARDGAKGMELLKGLDLGVARVHHGRALYLEGITRRALSAGNDMQGHGQARALFRKARELAESMGWWGYAARCAFQESKSAFKVGDMAGSRTALEAEAAIQEKRGNLAGVAGAYGSIAHYILARAGKYREALSLLEKAAVLAKRGGDLQHELWCLRQIASLHRRLGAFDKALEALESVQARMDENTRPQDRADLLMNRASVLKQQGGHARALELAERAIAIYEHEVKPRDDNERKQLLGWRAGALLLRGQLLFDLADYDEALPCLEEVIALRRARREDPDTASALTALGRLHSSRYRRLRGRGEEEGAEAALEAATKAFAEAQDFYEKDDNPRPVGVAHLLESIGLLQELRGEHEAALANFRKALATVRGMGDAHLELGILLSTAGPERALGRPEVALATIRQVRQRAAELGLRPMEQHALVIEAQLQFELGKHDEAITLAREGILVLKRKVGSLAEEEGVQAQRDWLGFYGAGVLGAKAAARHEDLVWALEQHHTGKLLASIEARRGPSTGAVPKDLLAQQASATKRLHAARLAVEKAQRRRNLRSRRRAMGELRDAQDRLLRVRQRIQRARRGAAVDASDVASLADIRSSLREGEALVTYFTPRMPATWQGPSSLAVVITPKDVRVVSLPDRADIEAAISALDMRDTAVAPDKALKALDALVVAPLKLPASVKRVLVAPHARLAYVPFGLLLPDREVAYVPSGTLLHDLRTRKTTPGTGVLALGDPEYRQGSAGGGRRLRSSTLSRLVPLPATRGEVEAVGTVGLLGAEANETKLAATLASRPRWKALHFACHGLVEPDNPMFSALAISRDAESDGFLTCLEILDMRLAVDLVASSACETARGKAYETDGVMGLTRTFMIAGAPRVLCSLWPVDDESSRALMVKFYELWNPKEGKGLSAAAALKGGQAHVRAQKKWAHPYYWAAWVLWGQPD